MPMCMNYTIVMNMRMITYKNCLWLIVCDRNAYDKNVKLDICEKHANASVMRL